MQLINDNNNSEKKQRPSTKTTQYKWFKLEVIYSVDNVEQYML